VALEKLASQGGDRSGWGIAFLVSAGIVAEIVAKACSSPQTVEINAASRADTLMKWVNVGMAEAAVFVVAAAVFDPGHARPILIGGAAEAAITYAEYLHGKRSGLRNGGPGTEGQGGAAAGPRPAYSRGG
jgi:hypothetical protein